MPDKLLYINPELSQKSKKPIDDSLTKLMQYAFSRSKETTPWKGVHTACDGTKSTNVDYKLENGMETNSLCVHYLRWFRNSIPSSDMIKLQKLQDFYRKK